MRCAGDPDLGHGGREVVLLERIFLDRGPLVVGRQCHLVLVCGLDALLSDLDSGYRCQGEGLAFTIKSVFDVELEPGRQEKSPAPTSAH